ncbi:DUF1345 domain-containing protein [Microbacterium sp. SORGH_AS_0888]|uniref:DUF1345 domain-containing protein n=1 Tax=Microbacterium sp. SORGH_AS_0888 TaxID=3041791 RepID=UPI0027852EB5|nr:DUF1345 domain-containing protein [Microbacterium sp. SORGH_AS_0888]MDQ1128154.1 putative membrane protein [Microbacterium sp. SORGH_AS_0888]
MAGAVATPPLGIAAGLLAGWGVFAIVQVVWILRVVWPMDAAQTQEHARAEDPGRPIARFVAVMGSVASLAAVGVVLLQSSGTVRTESFVLAAVALLSVAGSWALIQVDYMLRLAAVYYADPIGGIDFNQPEPPMYTDFAYVSFGLGVAYQVSDTNITSNAIRRLVIGQTLLAYLFGAVILATVINLVAGL